VGEIISERMGGIIPEQRAASPGIGTQSCTNRHFCALGAEPQFFCRLLRVS